MPAFFPFQRLDLPFPHWNEAKFIAIQTVANFCQTRFRQTFALSVQKTRRFHTVHSEDNAVPSVFFSQRDHGSVLFSKQEKNQRFNGNANPILSPNCPKSHWVRGIQNGIWKNITDLLYFRFAQRQIRLSGDLSWNPGGIRKKHPDNVKMAH